MAGATHRINFVTNFSAADQDIKNAIENLRFMGATASSANEKGSAAAKKFFADLGKLNSQATTTQRRFTTMNTLLAEVEMEWNRMGEASKKAVGVEVQNSIDQLRTKVNRLKGDLSGIGASASATAGSTGAAFGGFKAILGGNLAARAVMDVARGMKKVVEDAIETNMKFEYSNAELSAVLGVTKEDMIDLTEQAKRLGSTTLYAANEISQLQIVLARLGFNKQEIQDSTDSIAKLALATGVDLAKAATLTGSTLRAFGYDTKEAARVASVLGVSTTKSALDMQKLAVGMSYASSVSRQAGFDIEEVVAMLGKMADNGMQATTAGVNIRNIMLDLSDKSSRLSKAIKKVTGKDNVRGVEELISALRQMRDEGMNLDDVAATMERRVSNGFLNIVANTEGLTKLAKELKNCTGELDVMADKMENTLQGATKKLSNAWSGLMLTFNNGHGILKEAVQDLTNIVNAFNRWVMVQRGGNDAILAYEKGASDRDYNRDIRNYDKQIEIATKGKSGNDLEKATNAIYDSILETITSSIEQKANKRDEWLKLYSTIEGTNGRDYISKAKQEELGPQILSALGRSGGIWDENNHLFLTDRGDVLKTLAQQIAKWNDDIATLEREAARYVESPYTKKANSVDMSNAKGLGLGDKDKTGTSTGKTPEEIAEDALFQYSNSIDKIRIEREAGAIGELSAAKKTLQAEEKLKDVFLQLSADTNEENWKEAFKQQLQAVIRNAEEVNRLTEEAEALRNKIALNTRIRKGLERYTNQAGVGFGAVGLTGIQDQIAEGADIDWQPIVDKLNGYLAKKHFQIAVDLDSGSIEKLKDQLTDALKVFQDKLSNFSSVVSGIDNIKQSTESLIDTLQGEADAWDKTFAVINYGIGILQTFASIQQALNNLTTLSASIKDADAVSSMNQVSSSAASTLAKKQETGAALKDAGAQSLDAAAKTMNAHAWIPWVGVAIGAASVAAMLVALSRAKDVGNYATGGIVPGNSPTGDKLIAHVNSGEGILTAQGVRNLGALYAGQAGIDHQMSKVTFEIQGTKLIGATNNTIRAKGGKSSDLIYQH